MAREAPPDTPPATTQPRLRPEGNEAWLVAARVTINSKPPTFTTVVSKNALVRRAAYPPRKSLVPQARTAAKLKPAGTSWDTGVNAAFPECMRLTCTRPVSGWDGRGARPHTATSPHTGTRN